VEFLPRFLSRNAEIASFAAGQSLGSFSVL
jgi:hypothetical protein